MVDPAKVSSSCILRADSSFSTELSDLYRRIQRLKDQRDKLEVRLREDMAAPTLSLGQNARGAFVVNVKRKTEVGKLDRSPDFYVMSETRASKTFANNVSLHDVTGADSRNGRCLESSWPALTRSWRLPTREP